MVPMPEMPKRLPIKNRHDSMRGWFAYELHYWMQLNPDIWVVSLDLGFGMLDKIRDDFPERFLNVGASEQAGVGIACGLAMSGKIPFVYSITTFLLYRPFEFIRNYVNHEKLPVKLIGSGRDKDYDHDGFTHHSTEAKGVLDTLPNVVQCFPETKEEIPEVTKEIINNDKPVFLSLRR